MISGQDQFWFFFIIPTPLEPLKAKQCDHAKLAIIIALNKISRHNFARPKTVKG